MKVVVAIDSWKGSLGSLEAGASIAEGVHCVFPEAEVLVRPLADGGEGTVEALVLGMNGRLETVQVTGPLEHQWRLPMGSSKNRRKGALRGKTVLSRNLGVHKGADPLKTSLLSKRNPIFQTHGMEGKKWRRKKQVRKRRADLSYDRDANTAAFVAIRVKGHFGAP